MKTVKNNLIYLLKTMSYLNLACLFLVLAVSCSSGDSAPNNAIANLVVEVTLVGANNQNPNGDGSGVIQVTATANNATRYAFRFDNGDVQESNSGTMEYTFSEEGTNTYSVVAWAYSESGEFIN